MNILYTSYFLKFEPKLSDDAEEDDDYKDDEYEDDDYEDDYYEDDDDWEDDEDGWDEWDEDGDGLDIYEIDQDDELDEEPRNHYDAAYVSVIHVKLHTCKVKHI